MFRNRTDAGNRLARRLQRPWPARPLVLALPRGGAPVALPIAKSLEAKLDLLIVRKLGAPERSELAIGAIVDGTPPSTVFNDSILDQLGVDTEYVRQEIERQTAELRRRRDLYRLGGDFPDVRRQSVIVVDDGVATGATVKAALQAVRRRQPKTLVLAIPVAPPDTVRSLRKLADEVVCLEEPEDFQAVGQFYEDFEPVPDEEVIRILREPTSHRNGPGKSA